VSNKDWEKFDSEYKKLMIERKRCINSRWGKGIKKRILAIKNSKHFKTLERDWKIQVKYHRHKEFVSEVDELIKEAIPKNYEVSDLP